MIETEVKFRLQDADQMVEKLRKLGAREHESGFESNMIFDANGQLANMGEMLRLRTYSGRAEITHKRKVFSERMKAREETTIVIDSAENGRNLLEALGYRPIWRYEKKRRTFELSGVAVFIDTMPMIGSFMEIEGTEDKISKIARKLGFDMDDSIVKTYGTLFKEHCRDKGLPLDDMVFKEG